MRHRGGLPAPTVRESGHPAQHRRDRESLAIAPELLRRSSELADTAVHPRCGRYPCRPSSTALSAPRPKSSPSPIRNQARARCCSGHRRRSLPLRHRRDGDARRSTRLPAAADPRIIALDLARRVGAHETVLSDFGAAERIRALTDGLGAQVILDFVGAPPTTATAAAAAGVAADITVVGLGGGTVPVGFGSLPYETTVTSPYWGTRTELIEVLDLARRGEVSVYVETFALDEAPLAYERLHAGQITGRAVIVPNA
ncbi:zinc-binding dehydrogenase [Nocardia asteroides]|uniref:zinc-binding dehydrogenase n=1 Tax=Nocardia asteroides TaxID=1824 RepID=UPI003F4CD412